MKNTARSKKSSTRSRALKRAALAFTAALSGGCAHAPAVSPHAVPIVHRSPAPAWGEAAKRDLRAAIAQALAPAIARSYDWSCAVVSQNGTLLYSDRSAQAVIPASTLKLIVAAAVLAQFDPGYRFHTRFAGAGPRDGIIAGDLWLVGSGDPSLRSDDLRRGVAKLRAAGLRAIDGGVAVDASALAGPELNPFWNPGDANEDFMAATSGISIDEDTVEFRIRGTGAGEPASVRIKPPSTAVSYFGSVETGDGDDAVVAAMGTPGVFRVSGTVPPGAHEIFYLPVHDIPRYAGIVLSGFLREAGITFAAVPRIGRVPGDAQTLWDHPSPALTQLVHHMMIFSDNHFAEQFLRVLGGTRGRADDAHGLAAERTGLKDERIPVPGLHLVDGSGLADANRIAAITLVRLLARLDADPRGNALYPVLARGGLDGTLKRYHFAQARGRVRAKSGHLAAVSALAGYVDTRHHGRVAFAFLFNGVRDEADPAVSAAIDRIAQR